MDNFATVVLIISVLISFCFNIYAFSLTRKVKKLNQKLIELSEELSGLSELASSDLERLSTNLAIIESLSDTSEKVTGSILKVASTPIIKAIALRSGLGLGIKKLKRTKDS